MPSGSPTRGAVRGAIVGLVLFLIVFGLSDREMGFGRATFYPFHLVFASAVVLLSAFLFGLGAQTLPSKKRSKEIEKNLRHLPPT